MNKLLFLVFSLFINFSTFAADKAIVLMYHSIGDAKNTMTITENGFREQMAFLKSDGYNVISSKVLVEAIKDKKELPEKSVLLTFDDGWKNQIKAMNIMAEYKFPATFGLVTNVLESGYPQWLGDTDFAKYKENNFLYINHSYTHQPRSFIGKSEEDLVKSEAVLKKHVGYVEKIYIYPYGLSSASLVKTLKTHGYEAAFGVYGFPVNINHVNIFNIPRYLINNTVSLETFKSILQKVAN